MGSLIPMGSFYALLRSAVVFFREQRGGQITWKKNYANKISQMLMTKWKQKKVTQFWNQKGENIGADFSGMETFPPAPYFFLFVGGLSQKCCGWPREVSSQQVGGKRTRSLPQRQGIPLPCEHPFPELMLGSPSRCQSGTVLSAQQSGVLASPGSCLFIGFLINKEPIPTLGISSRQCRPLQTCSSARQVSAGIPEVAVVPCFVPFFSSAWRNTFSW